MSLQITFQLKAESRRWKRHHKDFHLHLAQGITQ